VKLKELISYLKSIVLVIAAIILLILYFIEYGELDTETVIILCVVGSYVIFKMMHYESCVRKVRNIYYNIVYKNGKSYVIEFKVRKIKIDKEALEMLNEVLLRAEPRGYFVR